jgi:hypothetical protein
MRHRQFDQGLIGALLVGPVGGAEFVARQGCALHLAVLHRLLELRARGVDAALAEQQVAQTGVAGRAQFRQLLHGTQGTLVASLGRIQLAQSGHRVGRGQLGFPMPALDPRLAQRSRRRFSVRQGRGRAAQLELERRPAQIRQCHCHGVVGRLEQPVRLVQPDDRTRHVAQPRQHLRALHLGPSAFDRCVQCVTALDCLVVQRQSLGQQVQREVRIGEIAPGLGQVLWNALGLGLAQRGFEQAQRGLEAATVQFEATAIGVDDALKRHQAARTHAHRTSVVQTQRFVKVELPAQGAG